MIITIDGPVASGKSTVALLLAEKLGFYYLNSGLLYRAIAYILNQQKIMIEHDLSISYEELSLLINPSDFHYTYDAKKHPTIECKNTDITPYLKSPIIDNLASIIAMYHPVRRIVLELQHAIVDTYDCIADGRDCGTKVFPSAEYKFFLTASLDVRAERWRSDQSKKGNNYAHEDAKIEIAKRDKRDTERTIAPLIQASDALVIDNSNLSIDETIALLISYIHS